MGVIFLRLRGPFDALDFVFLFQRVGQVLVNRHGEAIGIFAEGDAQELALKVARLALVLNLEHEKAAITIFGDVIVSDRLLFVYLDAVARYLKRIAVSTCPITEIWGLLFFGGGDLGSRDERDREKR